MDPLKDLAGPLSVNYPVPFGFDQSQFLLAAPDLGEDQFSAGGIDDGVLRSLQEEGGNLDLMKFFLHLDHRASQFPNSTDGVSGVVEVDIFGTIGYVFDDPLGFDPF